MRECGDLAGQIHYAESRVKDLRARNERQLGSLHPRVESEGSLAGLKVPPRDQVQRHFENERDWSEQSTFVELRADASRRELGDARALHERLIHEEEAVSAEAVAGARQRRDGTLEPRQGPPRRWLCPLRGDA